MAVNWKKTLPFFAWQTLRHWRKPIEFQQNWSYYPRWKASFEEGRSSVADEWAWITFPALDWLDQQLKPDSCVFEFGGGGSTLFFCKRVAEVVTVEDNADWFEILTHTVKEKGYQNWQGFSVIPEPITDSRARFIDKPGDFKSNVKGYENLSFEKYARTIDQFPSGYFDVVLVDGRARPSCIQQALPRLKKGGLLIVDNTERPYYLAPFQEIFARDFILELNLRAPVPYTPDFTQTTILRRK